MVQESGDDWHTLDTIWISNGVTNDPARVDIRLEFQEVDHES
jgi:hypothetical protein